MSELNILLEQLEELLHDPILDGSDALEIAIVAGLAERLGAEQSALQGSVDWRDGEGKELLDEGFASLDLNELVAAVDGLVGGDEEEVEEALSDFDDVVAACLWCGKGEHVREASKKVSLSIRQIPETFGCLASMGSSISALPAVGQNREIYDYWLAVAEAGQWV